MFHLSDGQKLLVLAICMGLLAFTVVITVCVVTPFCWMHGCLHKNKKLKKKYSDGEDPEESYIQLKGITPRYTLETNTPLKSLCKTISDASHFGNKHREDSTYSSMSSSSKGEASVSTYSETSMDGQQLPNGDADANYGQVTYSLRFRVDDDSNHGQLVIVVREAQYLPPRQYGGTCDPYVTIHLFKNKGKKRWSKHSNSCLYEFKTSSKKKTQHPLFKETFVMDVDKTEMKDYCLKIVAYDGEKYANDSELGQVTVAIKELQIVPNGEEQLHTVEFVEPRQDYGEILFGMSYLPTSERLTFTIVKANNLKYPVEDMETFAPFARVLLLHNGKLLKKKKTAYRQGSVSPIFNESLTFDIPPAQLDNVIFLVVISHRDTQDGSASSPESPTSPGSLKKGRHIGKVVIGCCSKGSALTHWNAMKQSPRKQVTQWHTLR